MAPPRVSALTTRGEDGFLYNQSNAWWKQWGHSSVISRQFKPLTLVFISSDTETWTQVFLCHEIIIHRGRIHCWTQPAGQMVKGTFHPKRKRREGFFINKFWFFGASGDLKSAGRAVWSHFSLTISPQLLQMFRRMMQHRFTTTFHQHGGKIREEE